MKGFTIRFLVIMICVFLFVANEANGVLLSTGPMCFNCTGISSPTNCRTTEICKPDEACFVDEKQIANEVLYDLGCRNQHICAELSGSVPVIGRRKRSVHCTKCCYDSLCNNYCGMSTPTTKLLTKETTTLTTTSGTTPTTTFLTKGTTTLTGVGSTTTSVTTPTTTLLTKGTTTLTGVGSTTTSGTTPTTMLLTKGTTTLPGGSSTTTSDSCNKIGICRNNGVCLQARNGYTCRCEKGFFGKNCEMSGLQGNSFVVIFIETLSKMNPKYIYITSDDIDGNCTILSPFNNSYTIIDIHKQSTSVYDVKPEFELTNGNSTKGLFIQCNIEVFVIAFNEEFVMSDGWSTFPVSLLGKEYIIPSYTPSYFPSSVFGIVALQNNTKITVELKSEGGIFFHNNHNYTNGSEINLNMSFLETFQISMQSDLSGTRISSSEPVAVVSGNTCEKVQGLGCSHLAEMVIPVKDFSNLFIIPILEHGYRAMLRAFASNTTKIIMTTKQNVNQSFTIFPQGYKEFNYSDISILSSSENIMLQLYGSELVNRDDADAFMMTVPGVNQFMSRYVFYVPDFEFNSSLSFIIKSDEVFGIRLDGKTVFPQALRNVTVSTVEYTTFAIYISPGRHIAEQINHVAFGLFIYGKRYADGYGYPAAIGLLTK